jgi:hypothetical protein
MSAPDFSVTSGPAHGSATIGAATGMWSYAPLADYHGSDSFTVTVTDNEGKASTQVISLAVTPIGDIAVDAAATAEDAAVTTGVLANDSFENAGRTIAAASNGSNGTVTIVDAAAGTLRYTPDADFHGTDSYTYTVTSNGVTETATVTVTVAAVDDPAVFGGGTIGTGAEDGGAITGTLTVSDADGMGAPSFAVTSGALHGTASIDPVTGAWSYIPVADYEGADSFTVRFTAMWRRR